MRHVIEKSVLTMFESLLHCSCSDLHLIGRQSTYFDSRLAER
jgi:hypothetical protein